MKIKKLLSIFLAALMLFTMIPTGSLVAMAAGDWTSADNPYEIMMLDGKYDKSQLYKELLALWSGYTHVRYDVNGLEKWTELTSSTTGVESFTNGTTYRAQPGSVIKISSFFSRLTYNELANYARYFKSVVYYHPTVTCTVPEGITAAGNQAVLDYGKNYVTIDGSYYPVAKDSTNTATITLNVKEIAGYDAYYSVDGAEAEALPGAVGGTHSTTLDIKSSVKIAVTYEKAAETKGTVSLSVGEGVTASGITVGETTYNAGDYTLALAPADSNHYVKAINVDGTDVLDVTKFTAGGVYSLDVSVAANERKEIVVETGTCGVIVKENVGDVKYNTKKTNAAQLDALKEYIFDAVADGSTAVTWEDVTIQFKSTRSSSADVMRDLDFVAPTGIENLFHADNGYSEFGDNTTETVTVTWTSTDNQYPSSSVTADVKLVEGRITPYIEVDTSGVIEFETTDYVKAQLVSRVKVYDKEGGNIISGAAVSFKEFYVADGEANGILPTFAEGEKKINVTFTVGETNESVAVSETEEKTFTFKAKAKPSTVTLGTVAGNGTVTVKDTTGEDVSGETYAGSVVITATPKASAESNIGYYVEAIKVNGAEVVPEYNSCVGTYTLALTPEEEYVIDVAFAERKLAVKETLGTVPFNFKKDLNAQMSSVKEAIINAIVDGENSTALNENYKVEVWGNLMLTEAYVDISLSNAFFNDKTEKIKVTVEGDSRYPTVYVQDIVVSVVESRPEATYTFTDPSTVEFETAEEAEAAIKNALTSSNGGEITYVKGAELPTGSEEVKTIKITYTIAETDETKETVVSKEITFKAAAIPSKVTVETAGEGKGKVSVTSGGTAVNGSAFAGELVITATPDSTGDSAVAYYVDSIAVNDETIDVSYNGNIGTASYTIENDKEYKITVTFAKRELVVLDAPYSVGFNPIKEATDEYMAEVEAAVIKAIVGENSKVTAEFYIANDLFKGYHKITENFYFSSGFGTGVEANGKDSEKIKVTLHADGKLPEVSKEVTISLYDSRSDAGISFAELADTIRYNSEAEIEAAIKNNISNPNGISYTLKRTSDLPSEKNVETDVTYSITFDGNESYKAYSKTVSVKVLALIQPASVTLDSSVSANGTVKVKDAVLAPGAAAQVPGEESFTIEVTPGTDWVVESISVDGNALSVSYNNKVATASYKAGDGAAHKLVVTYSAKGSISIKSGTISYCYDRDKSVDLEKMVFDAVFASSVPAGLNVNKVDVQYKSGVVAIGDYGWNSVGENPSLTINGIIHKFGQEGSEEIRVVYTDAKYGTVTSNTVTLEVNDSCYNVTINPGKADKIVAPSGVTAEKLGKYKENTAYSVVAIPNPTGSGNVYIEDIIVTDKNGNRVNGTVSYSATDSSAMIYVPSAKTSFTTETNGEYSVEVVYGVAKLNVTSNAVELVKYDGVAGKYNSVVPTAEEIFNAVIESANPTEFGVYSAQKHTVEYSLDGVVFSSVDTLGDIASDREIIVRISYKADSAKYNDISADKKISLVDNRFETVITNNDITEPVKFKSEDVLLDALKNALDIKVTANGKDIADYTISVISVTGDKENSLAKVAIKYDGSAENKPASKTLEIPVTDVPDKSKVEITASNGSTTFGGAEGATHEVTGNITYELVATPNAGYAVEAITFVGSDGSSGTCDISYLDQVATASLKVVEGVNYTVEVEFAKAEFELAQDAKLPFRTGVEKADVNKIYDAVVNAPARADGAEIKVLYLAREATTIEIEIPGFTIGDYTFDGRTINIPLEETWLEVGEEIKEVTLDDLIADQNNAEYLKYYGAKEFGANGDGSTEKIKVSYEDNKWLIAETETSLTIVDGRAVTSIASKDEVSLVYGFTTDDFMKAVGATVVTADGAIVNGEVVCLDEVEGLDADEAAYEITLSFAGDENNRPAQKTVKLTVEKATATVKVESQTVIYGTEGITVEPVTDPEGISTIDFVIGIDVEDDLEGFVQLRLPGKLGEYFEGEMTLEELREALLKLTELGSDVADGLGFDLTTVETLLDGIENIAENLELPNMKIKVNGDLVPENIGAYIVGSVIADGNYKTAADVGYLVIVPEATKVDLEWNIKDENGIITLPVVQSGEYDLGASVVKGELDDEAWAQANSLVKHVFVGVNQNGEIVSSTEPIAQNGAYAELAYLLDWGNELYYAEPIARAFLITPQTVDVKFEDANENNAFKFTYDGTAHAVDAVVYTASGEAVSAEKLSENLKLHYYGISNDGTKYNSEEAPVNAGAYTAIATYTEKDAQGNYVLFGMNVAAVAILPGESVIEVESDVIEYDGYQHSLNVTTTPEAEYILIMAGLGFDEELVTADDTINVDFPEKVDELLKELVPEAYENGVKLVSVLDILTKSEEALKNAGIATENLTALIDNLKVFPEDTMVTFSEQADVAPSEVGAYMFAAIVCDPNYMPDIDVGLMTITPSVVETELYWNQKDANGIITATYANEFDFGASAKAEDAEVSTIFVGLNAEDIIYYSSEASTAIGTYTEAAYIADASAVTYIAKPIIRSYAIVPELYTVKFIDENGDENPHRSFEYDGNAHAMSAKAFGIDGRELTSGEMTVTYIGTEGDYEFYRSTEAPVNAGSYRVVAIYVEHDAEGNFLGAGTAIGIMVIGKAELSFEVLDTEVEYDAQGHFADANNPENTDYLTAVYADGKVNITFPSDLKEVVELLPTKDYTAANIGDEFAQLSEKIDNAEVKEALSKLADYASAYGDAGVIIDGAYPTEVGTYDVAAVCVSENYKVKVDTAKLTIVPRKVTITVDSAEKIAGEADPTFTYTVENLLDGDDLDIIVSRTEGEEAGEYEITATYTENKNYDVTVVNGTLTINPKEEVNYLAGRSLMLEDIVHIRYYWDFTAVADKISKTGLLFWTEEEYSSIDVHDISTAGAYHLENLSQRLNGGRILYYGNSYGIPAKNMIDKQFVRAYAVLNDGTIVYTEICEFSPVMYCQHILREGSTSRETMKALAVAIMNYGAAAQVQFNYKKDTLMNDWLTDDQKALNWSDSLVQGLPEIDSSKFNLTNDTAFAKAGASLTLDGNIKQNFYFDVQNEAIANASEMKVLYWTESEYNSLSELTVENAHTASLAYDAYNSANAKINCYRSVFEGVAAKDLRDAFVVAVYYKDVDGNDHYSQLFADGAHDYVRRMAASNRSEAMKNLAKAFLIYHIAAENELLYN